MATKNLKTQGPRTYEGGPAITLSAEKQLRRAVLSCLLWESNFYESGESVADRIIALSQKVKPETAIALAVEARKVHGLRHAPLLILRALAKVGKLKAATLAETITRVDDMTEFLSLYWLNGKEPISRQVRLGLAEAFGKFNEYQLAKYNRKKEVKLADILKLTHPKPKDDAQRDMWGRLLKGELTVPDTWEVALSRGDDKRETWLRLISEKKLGGFATLRNLRNMTRAGVPDEIIREAIKSMNIWGIMPYQFIAAANAAPNFEPELEVRMAEAAAALPKITGITGLLVDVSASMNVPMSERSALTRMDAACGIAMILRQMCETISVATFSDECVVVPARRGFALRDVIVNSQSHSSTRLGEAVRDFTERFDRLIVITDEQAEDVVSKPAVPRAYMMNVATYKNAVGFGDWIRIDGFSSEVARFVAEYEKDVSVE